MALTTRKWEGQLFSRFRTGRTIRRKLVRYAWWSSNKAAAANLISALESPDGAKRFDLDWLKALVARRDEMRKSHTRILITSLAPGGYLALALLGVDVGISLFGLSLRNSDRLFELSLFVSSAMAAIATPLVLSIGQADAMIKAWVGKVVGSKASLYIHAFTSTVPTLPVLHSPPGDTWAPSLSARLLGLAWVSATLVAAASIVGGLVLVHLGAIFRVLERSGEPLWLSYSVAMFAIVIVAIDILIYCLFALPVLYEDYSELTSLAKIGERNPKAFKERFLKLLSDGTSKPKAH